MSALFRWPCSISTHLSPRSVTARIRPFPLAMLHFYSFVSQVCHCWCPPFSDVAFLCICLPNLSLLVSALFRWPCSISMHMSPRSVTAGIRPFPLAMLHFYSFVSQVCHCWCPPFSDVTFLCICLPSLVAAGVRPFPLAMLHFYSFVSQVCHCWCPPFSVGHVAVLRICLPSLSLLVSALFRWPCCISIHLSPRSVTAGVRPFPLAM